MRLRGDVRTARQEEDLPVGRRTENDTHPVSGPAVPPWALTTIHGTFVGASDHVSAFLLRHQRRVVAGDQPLLAIPLVGEGVAGVGH